MDKRILGDTGILVSRLCFGSLTISPLQAKFPTKKAAGIIAYAIDRGVNFIDTAEYYRNYDQIRHGIMGQEHEVVICSKTYAYEAKQARISVEKALKGLNRDYIDIFMLHEQESKLTLQGHEAALVELHKCKAEGKIKAVGMSTHYIKGVKAATNHPLIEVVHPLVNKTELGIVDGSVGEMLNAITELSNAGKGIYTMKALGGGNLHNQAYQALDFVLKLDEVAAIAVGMQSYAEIDANVQYFSQRCVGHSIQEQINNSSRRLHIANWCQGCGKCVHRCPNSALQVREDKVTVIHEKCLLCGYCSEVCPDFCIKVI